MEVEELLAGVHDRATVLAFVHALAEDWELSVEAERKSPSHFASPTARGWQNGSIDTFLDAAAAWAEPPMDPSVQRDVFPEEPSWRAFAR